MTMPKNTSNIWSRVRDDVDVDDLIFRQESYHNNQEDEHCSDR